MNRSWQRWWPSVLAAVFLGSSAAAAGKAEGGSARFDAAMQPIVAQYLRAQAALASDSEKGVAAVGREIAKLAARLDAASVQGPRAAPLKELPAKLKSAAEKLAAAKGIARARAAFKELSRPLALWATTARPAGLNVVYCSMAKASWLQREKAVRNPYYGASMLRCGEIVSGPDKGHSDGHMK